MCVNVYLDETISGCRTCSDWRQPESATYSRRSGRSGRRGRRSWSPQNRLIGRSRYRRRRCRSIQCTATDVATGQHVPTGRHWHRRSRLIRHRWCASLRCWGLDGADNRRSISSSSSSSTSSSRRLVVVVHAVAVHDFDHSSSCL